MESINELRELIVSKYDVSDEAKTSKRGTIKLEIKEFNELGIHKVNLEQYKNKGLSISFGSHETQANFLASNIEITQGVNRFSSWVWGYINSRDEAIVLLDDILKYSRQYPSHHIEELEEEYNRVEIENLALNGMSPINRMKYEGFWEVAKELNSNLGSIFHVDHAMSIHEGREKAIENSNLQILVKGINTSKSDTSWERLTYAQQCEHISVCAQIIPHADQDVVNLLIKKLELYWD